MRTFAFRLRRGRLRASTIEGMLCWQLDSWLAEP
jgi:hypothetical protein